ncbi:MAG: hypothetical protein JRI23_09280 [Deltaproteobacteria bacterium]|jgi:hypothetical protein|nr:hypothetical protein [Deltaproteobacteria bacterium]MBW2531831.1 hypothetical protein [Deltaproteobacteria bacterium]
MKRDDPLSWLEVDELPIEALPPWARTGDAIVVHDEEMALLGQRHGSIALPSQLLGARLEEVDGEPGRARLCVFVAREPPAIPWFEAEFDRAEAERRLAEVERFMDLPVAPPAAGYREAAEVDEEPRRRLSADELVDQVVTLSSIPGSVVVSVLAPQVDLRPPARKWKLLGFVAAMVGFAVLFALQAGVAWYTFVAVLAPLVVLLAAGGLASVVFRREPMAQLLALAPDGLVRALPDGSSFAGEQLALWNRVAEARAVSDGVEVVDRAGKLLMRIDCDRTVVAPARIAALIECYRRRRAHGIGDGGD